MEKMRQWTKAARAQLSKVTATVLSRTPPATTMDNILTMPRMRNGVEEDTSIHRMQLQLLIRRRTCTKEACTNKGMTMHLMEVLTSTTNNPNARRKPTILTQTLNATNHMEASITKLLKLTTIHQKKSRNRSR